MLRDIQDGCDAKLIYAKGCNVYQETNRNSEKFLREAIVAAQKADVVILCMGLNHQMEQEEAMDSTWGAHEDKIDLELPDVQRELLAEISKVGKPMVFVNTSGNCVSPSGRLPVTFYHSVDALPLFEEYSSLRVEGDALSVVVRNTGRMQAKEVIQVYEITDSIKLVGSRKVQLSPGEETIEKFTVGNPHANFQVGGGMPDHNNEG